MSFKDENTKLLKFSQMFPTALFEVHVYHVVYMALSTQPWHVWHVYYLTILHHEAIVIIVSYLSEY